MIPEAKLARMVGRVKGKPQDNVVGDQPSATCSLQALVDQNPLRPGGLSAVLERDLEAKPSNPTEFFRALDGSCDSTQRPEETPTARAGCEPINFWLAETRAFRRAGADRLSET